MLDYLTKKLELFIKWRPHLPFYVLLILLSVPLCLLYANYKLAFFKTTLTFNASSIKQSAHGPFSYVISFNRKLPGKTKLFENGNQLPNPYSVHTDIGTIGNGRYSVWGKAVYFSSSDNSDPRTNGREYKIITPAGIPLIWERSLLCLTLAAFFLFMLKIKNLYNICMSTTYAVRFLKWIPGTWYFILLFILMLPYLAIYVNDKAAFIVKDKLFSPQEICPVPAHGVNAYCVMLDTALPQYLAMMEDGKALPLGNSMHVDIGKLGKGRYSIWGKAIYFSSTDNSDPRTNGRAYSIKVPADIGPFVKITCLLLFWAAMVLFIAKVNYIIRYPVVKAIWNHPLYTVAVLSLLLHFGLIFSTPLIFMPDTDSYLLGTLSLLRNGSLEGLHSCRCPGLALLYAPVMFIFDSYSLWPLKIFIHLLAVGCNILTVMLAYELTGKKWLAFITGFLTLIWLDGIYYSEWVSSEIPSALSLLLFTYFLIKALKGRKIKDYYLAAFMASWATLMRAENLMLLVFFMAFTLLTPLFLYIKRRDIASRRAIVNIIIAFVLSCLPLLAWSSYNYYRLRFFGLTSYGMVAFHDSALVSGMTLKVNFEDTESPSVKKMKEIVVSYDKYNVQHGKPVIEGGAFQNAWYDTEATRYYLTGCPYMLDARDLQKNRDTAIGIDQMLYQANKDSMMRNPDKYMAMQLVKAYRIFMSFRSSFIFLYPPELNRDSWVCPYYQDRTQSEYTNYFRYETDVPFKPVMKLFSIYYSFHGIYAHILFFLFLIAIPGFFICFFRRPFLVWCSFLLITFSKIFLMIFLGHPSARVIFQGSYLYIILGVCTIWTVVAFLPQAWEKLKIWVKQDNFLQ